MPKEIRPEPRTRLLSWRDAIADTDLPPHVKLVAFVLSLHMNRQGSSCFPGRELLMRQSSLGKSAVMAHLKALEDAGWLTSEKRAGRGGPRAYVATFPRSVELAVAADLTAEPSAQPDDSGASESSAQPDGSIDPKSPTVRQPSVNRPAGRTPLSTERTKGRKDEKTPLDAEPDGFTLAPYIDLHIELLGGLTTAPAGTMATVFKDLWTRGRLLHPDWPTDKLQAKLLRHQRHYLHQFVTGESPGHYLSYPKFGDTFNTWAVLKSRGADRPTTNVHGKDFRDGMDQLNAGQR